MESAYVCGRIKELCADYKDALTFGEVENAEKDLSKIRNLLDAFGAEHERHFDSVFFAGELDYNAGEKNVQYPDAVSEYRKRRKKRKDCAAVKRFKDRQLKRMDDDGRWVTTENDHHIHINEEGVPDKGNPHVLKAMTSGTKTREQIVRGRVQKTKSRVDSALKSYRDSDEQVKKYAKEYYDKGTTFKHAQHRLDMIDKVYKKTLSDNGYEEKDGERLRKEVDDLKKQLEVDPYNSDLKGKFNNKNFLLAEWEDCYGEEAKQIRKDFDGLKRDSEAAKKELQKHLDARKSALSEARKAMGERDAQSMKFYNDDEREEIKESVINSDGFQNLNDEEKAAISASLDNVSDAQLAMLKKSSENAKIMRYEDTAATTGCSHYSSGSGCMYLEEEDRKNPKVFWHEYGHYMDDFRHSGLEDNVVTYGEGSPYESHSSSFSDILESDVHIRGEDAAKDIQEMLDEVSLGRFEVVTNSDGTYLGVRDQKVGTYTDSDINLRMDLQRAFDKVVDNYLDGGENGGEIAEYYRSIGYPQYEDRPNRDDYIESYTTPKRKLEREREKYKGAEEEYYRKLNEFYDEQERVKAEHPDFHDKVSEMYDRKREREKHISAVTDCLCGVFGGETFSIYGCHDPSYYKVGKKVENEWSANIHQMMLMQDKEALSLMEKLMPRTMKKVRTAYNEYLWRNMVI